MEATKKDIDRQHTYITKCNRNECAAIFATRTIKDARCKKQLPISPHGLNM